VERFLEATASGLGQGSLYAVLGLGFVIVYKGTGVISFVQPALMILGAYFTSALAVDQGVPFVPALLIAVVATVLVAGAIERLTMRPLIGEPAFSAVMVTIGVFLVLEVIAANLIGSGQRGVGDPWGLEKVELAGVSVFETDLARIAIAAAAAAALGLFYTRSRWGLALRATAFSQETALAQGIPVGRMFALTWALAGALAAIAGMLAGTGGGGFDETTTLVALKAIPAIVLGGLDSIRGAVVGGALIGLVEGYTKAYQADHFAWLGANFDQVVPYAVMLLVLLVRPYGLFGTPEVRRV
jgi:branched-chain amino acid transport system permease protein